jgi:hypothetical protein
MTNVNKVGASGLFSFEGILLIPSIVCVCVYEQMQEISWFLEN